MKWITRERVGVDRMGSAWLIQRFIDPQAEFAFLPSGQTALPEGAEPFDISGVRLSHRGGHCTFHTILEEYKLDDPVLQRIAGIVDEADVAQEVNLESIAAGLDAICRGLRLTSADDPSALRNGATVFEALYAQLAVESTK